MRIGYIRNNHNKDKNNYISYDKKIDRMKKANIERIVVEIFSGEDNDDNKGKETEKENQSFESALLSCVNDLKENDTLVILELNELGDSLVDVVNVLKLIDKKKAHIEIIDDYFENIDINKEQLIATLAWVSDKERKDIIQRQARGLLVAKAKNMKGSGRKKKYSPDAENLKDRETYFTILSMLEENVPIKRISDLLNVSRHTIYSIKNEIEKE